jgi:hypothetical protein
MSDLIDKVGEAKAACAETMLQPLWAHIGLHLAVEPSALAEYVEPLVGDDLDPTAVRITYEKDIEHHVAKAIDGYVDWAGCRIVRNGDFEPMDVPTPSIVDTLNITSEYDVKPAILRFVIERLREETVVPLLGKIEGGFLVPDETALKEWATHFDWNDVIEVPASD